MNYNNRGERADVATSDPRLSSRSEERADVRVRRREKFIECNRARVYPKGADRCQSRACSGRHG